MARRDIVRSTTAHPPTPSESERRGAVRDEGRFCLPNPVGEGELELGNEELLDVRAANVIRLLELDDTENLQLSSQIMPQASSKRTYVDRPETSTVPGSHVLVQRLHGVCTGELTELLVHVVRSGARVITQPDTKVFDLQGLLLVDLEKKYT
jgi:hypothetical protein